MNRRQRRKLERDASTEKVEKVQLVPGATSRDMAAMMANVGGRSNAGSPRPQPSVQTGGGADWFGPLDPISPVAPPEVESRQWDFPVGYNLQTTVKPYEGVNLYQLRALADSHDILREVIETRKDQIAKLPWGIKSRVLPSGGAETDDDDPIIGTIEQFFKKPDGRHYWAEWIRMLLEDLLVIDAPAIYTRVKRSGQLVALEPIDGATIKPIIDDWGRLPAPPIPAYQQILHGMPAVPYTTDQLHYAPRNVRTGKVYGYSPTEQVVMTVNIALRRQMYLLQYYTEGNIPEAMVGVPETWSPEQIRGFQNNFDAMLAGNTAARRRLYFMPGGAAKFASTKDPELTNKTDEWLARVICFCFSISPQPFVAQVNRATAETAHEQSLQEGLAPLMLWVKQLVDFFIEKYWPGAKVEFAWTDDRQVDQKDQEAVLSGYAKIGAMTINEIRDRLGLDPIPEGNVLRVMTANGYVKIDANDNAPDPGEVFAATTAAAAKAPKPGEPGNDSKNEGAQAAKVAEPFRKGRKAYWQAPAHADPPHQGGPGG